MILSTEFIHELKQNTHRELAFVGLAECLIRQANASAARAYLCHLV